MSTLTERLATLSGTQLAGIRRGVEKESLRTRADGQLALTPHPAALGSALTHPHITTDFSESQLELITGVHGDAQSCLDQLTRIHQFVYRTMKEKDERLWVSSMPCALPADEAIPLGRYGSSNIGRSKSVYRMGLSHRYGRRMQTISGIHYNWSMPGLDTAAYFGLLRNLQRHAFLLLVLFGASPAVCASFVRGLSHELLQFNESTMYAPYGTSLRMGRLGYQSEAQSSVRVSYNDLESYVASLQDALTRPWPAYEAIGIRNASGAYNQLSTSLLQIENEFYSLVRPKRVILPGERQLHALRARGVEYVEIRLMDLDPFEPVGISTQTMHLLDVFLLHCLLTDSPPDTPEEIAEIGHNRHLSAARGREPGLRLLRAGREVTLAQWGEEILAECEPIAAMLDAHLERLGSQPSPSNRSSRAHTQPHAQALRAARAAWAAPETLPSARVLRALADMPGHSFFNFGRAQSDAAMQHLLALPWSPEHQAFFERATSDSIAEQARAEAADTMPFEAFRQIYVSPECLHVQTACTAV
ncbi:MAG: glutamate--cysteine ligase [Burkholderiaceae bacterium]|jgi:glutamate--cysteine ligase|nr:glutamate--cysteine ligase [Burkholderiaceae bacterium]